MGNDELLKVISNFGWWLYVKVGWRKNLVLRKKLMDEELRDNLGYFLRESHPDFRK